MSRYYYKNKSSGTQSINTNAERSLHVAPGEEVALESGEETSVEITSKVNGSRATGQLRKDDSTSDPTPKPRRSTYPVEKGE